MDDSDRSPSTEHLATLVTDGRQERAAARLERYESATTDDRKAALRTLQRLADERPSDLTGVVQALTPFLDDDERAIRLTTAKLFVTIAESEPDSIVPVVASLAERLADEDEFYYVRARSAEALGYVALEHPDEVSSPEILADLRVGLSFDEPEVKEKLAKTLEYVALGDPRRLRHQISTLADHLDDDDDLVRYHLSTTLVAVGSAHPERLTDATAALVERLDDDNPHVRGRAAEALGVLGLESDIEAPLPEVIPEGLVDDEAAFARVRARFAVESIRGATPSADTPDTTGTAIPDEIGTLRGIRDSTDGAVEEITSPDGKCPHCGLVLPEDGQPMCPRCGTPR